MPQPKSRKIAVLGYRSVGKCVLRISFFYFPHARDSWMSPHARAASSLAHAFKHELKYHALWHIRSWNTPCILVHIPNIVFRMRMLICRCVQASVQCHTVLILPVCMQYVPCIFILCVFISYIHMSASHRGLYSFLNATGPKYEHPHVKNPHLNI